MSKEGFNWFYFSSQWDKLRCSFRHFNFLQQEFIRHWTNLRAGGTSSFFSLRGPSGPTTKNEKQEAWLLTEGLDEVKLTTDKWTKSNVNWQKFNWQMTFGFGFYWQLTENLIVPYFLQNLVFYFSSEKRRLFGGKKGLKSSFNYLKLFCLDIFDQPVGFY